MLYPTELRTEIASAKDLTDRGVVVSAQNNGRGERIRTFDPLVPNQMRYQAALHPDKPLIIASNLELPAHRSQFAEKILWTLLPDGLADQPARTRFTHLPSR